MPNDNAFFGMFALWLLVGIGLMVFYASPKLDLNLKKKLHPWVMSGTGVLFIYLLSKFSLPAPLFLSIALFLVISFIANITMTRFCDFCAKTVFNRQFLSKIKFCPYCGGKLEAKKTDGPPLK